MKTHWKILLIVGIFLVVMVVVGLLTTHIQPQNEVEAYKKLLRDHGEKFEISEVLPAPVPEEQNGAGLVVAAAKLFFTNGVQITPGLMQMVEPGKAMICWVQPDVHESYAADGSGYTNTWDGWHSAVEADRPAMKLLQQAANFPVLDFHIDYSNVLIDPTSHVLFLVRSVRKLGAATIDDLHNRQTASAVTNVCVLLALMREWQYEKNISSQLIRLGLISFATSLTWESLQATNMTDAELVTLQNNWEKMEFIHAVKNGMEMDRAAKEKLIKKMRESNVSAYNLLSRPAVGSSANWWQAAKDALENTRDKAAIAYWRSVWTYSDELLLLKYNQAILEALRAGGSNYPYQTLYSNLVIQTKNFHHECFAGGTPVLETMGVDEFRRIFSSLMFMSGENIIHRVAAAEVSKRVAMTAIALKRFQMKHGNFPKQLSELIPDYLLSVPLDPLDENPLRYRRNADGTFLLYSVGMNGKDDGGDPLLVKGVEDSNFWQSFSARDWVWPQPATATEIEAFYAHQSTSP